jgi:hypothetical protein
MIYTATFNAVAVTAAQDFFEITAPANSRVRIRECRIGQYTDFGDAAAEILSVLVIRGFTTSGSVGGTAPTPSNVSGHSGALAAGSVVEINNTTLANTGSAVTLYADTWNIATPWWFAPSMPSPRNGWWGEHLILAPSQRLVFRITAPADSITCNGTLVFEELGFGGAA